MANKKTAELTSLELFDRGQANRTPTVLASEILRLMKEKERIELLFPVIANIPALRLCAAWAGYPVEPRWPAGEPPKGENAAIEWLWSEMRNLDLDSLAVRSGLGVAEAEKAFELCRTARAIYPDGTLSPTIQDALRRQVEMFLSAPPEKAAQ